MSNIAITGTTGSIGKSLFKYLSQLDRYSVFEINRRAGVGAKDKYIVTKDYASPKLTGFLKDKQIDLVIHLAGIVDSNSEDIFSFNSEQTGVLANSLGQVREGAKFMFASTAAVYGDKGDKPYREDDHLSLESNYAKSKFYAEELISDAASKYGLEFINMRKFNVYGAGLKNSLINKLLGGASPSVYWTNKYIRDYISLNDLILIITKLMNTDYSGVVNIGNGIGWGNISLVNHLEDKAGELAFNKVEAENVNSYSVACIDRLCQLTDYKSNKEILLEAI